jgi:rare lipoprotein A (peptidoglycan hydrolase)
MQLNLSGTVKQTVHAISTRKGSLHSTQRPTSADSEGLASVYSDQDTASGEKMNPNDMTAAYRTPPFGTKVTVVNRRNVRWAVVRINDRGSFVNGRVMILARQQRTRWI